MEAAAGKGSVTLVQVVQNAPEPIDGTHHGQHRVHHRPVELRVEYKGDGGLNKNNYA